jgi:hypothetical protein
VYQAFFTFSMTMLVCILCTTALAAAQPTTQLPSMRSLAPSIRASLQEIADAESKKYDCAFSIAIRAHDGTEVAVGSGGATSTSDYAWGSCTKMVTGVSAIRLANEGVFSLDDPIAPILDPYWQRQGGEAAGLSMAKIFGPKAKDVTIRHLATMMAGLPDFDTAKPNETDFSKSTDPFRATVYKNPTIDYSPYDLLKMPWVSTGKLDFAPGTDKEYSSTNFLVLGLVIAAVAGPDGQGVAWDKFDQYAFRPKSLVNQLLNNTVFARRGSPDHFVTLSAYDRTSYNGHSASSRPGLEVNKVHGVFAGWTASDIVAPVQDIADLAFDIYGDQSRTSLVTQAEVEMMTNKSQGESTAPSVVSVVNVLDPAA